VVSTSSEAASMQVVLLAIPKGSLAEGAHLLLFFPCKFGGDWLPGYSPARLLGFNPVMIGYVHHSLGLARKMQDAPPGLALGRCGENGRSPQPRSREHNTDAMSALVCGKKMAQRLYMHATNQ
jgi:hypothetical protein